MIWLIVWNAVFVLLLVRHGRQIARETGRGRALSVLALWLWPLIATVAAAAALWFWGEE